MGKIKTNNGSCWETFRTHLVSTFMVCTVHLRWHFIHSLAGRTESVSFQAREHKTPLHFSNVGTFSIADGNKQFTKRWRFVARNKYLPLGRKPPRSRKAAKRTAGDYKERRSVPKRLKSGRGMCGVPRR